MKTTKNSKDKRTEEGIRGKEKRKKKADVVRGSQASARRNIGTR